LDPRADDAAARAEIRWSFHFLSDTVTNSRRFGILAIVDDVLFLSVCVTRELSATASLRGCQTTVVSNNGTKLTSMAILRWS